MYLNVPPVRKPLQNTQIDSWRTTGCVGFRGDLCKIVNWETFINEQKGQKQSTYKHKNNDNSKKNLIDKVK